MSSPFSIHAHALLAELSAGWRRYAFALLCVAVAFLVRVLLSPVMGQQSVAVFLAAILINAWVGRRLARWTGFTGRKSGICSRCMRPQFVQVKFVGAGFASHAHHDPVRRTLSLAGRKSSVWLSHI